MTRGKIVKSGIQVACGIAICVGLAACSKPTAQPVLPEFQEKVVNSNARGITIATTKPYHCRMIGETEGYDEVKGQVIGATKARLRRGAINDMKNESTFAIQPGKKVMISIAKEEMRCLEKPRDAKGKIMKNQKLKEIDCTEHKEFTDDTILISYKVYGDLLECGTEHAPSVNMPEKTPANIAPVLPSME